MAFLTGLLLIDAPASALNNQGTIAGSMTDNAVGVKYIPTPEGAYPYVSAQAFRYWLRTTLENGPWGWKPAPIFREKKIAYTDANPIRYWDDDLFGYMRAPSKKAEAVAAREESGLVVEATPTKEAVTRVSPFRVSTLVSVAPTRLVNDYGTMSRHEGNPVPHEHQFYRTTLQGLLSLDLHAAGTFTYVSRTGYLNLDEPRVEEAQAAGLTHLPQEKAYRLSNEARLARINALLQGLVHLEGGAKQTLHYTDVSPDVLFLTVTRGGNHIFGHIIGRDSKNRPTLHLDALQETLDIHQDDILSPIYVGWVRGFMDGERAKLEEALADGGPLAQWRDHFHISHPRQAVSTFIEALKEHADAWLA